MPSFCLTFFPYQWELFYFTQVNGNHILKSFQGIEHYLFYRSDFSLQFDK